MGLLIILLLGLLVYAVVKGSQQTTVLGNKHHLLDKMSYTSQEFYFMLEELIQRQELNSIQLSRISYAERGLLSARREYLRIRYQNYVFDVCAAPFAKSFFVSWWFSEFGTPVYDLFKKIPIVGAFMVKRPKSFYEIDTENMIKESILQCVNKAITLMDEPKGIRNEPLLN